MVVNFAFQVQFPSFSGSHQVNFSRLYFQKSPMSTLFDTSSGMTYGCTIVCDVRDNCSRSCSTLQLKYSVSYRFRSGGLDKRSRPSGAHLHSPYA
ncbi:hypothetical protein ACFX15_024669 [Malus domestica]